VRYTARIRTTKPFGASAAIADLWDEDGIFIDPLGPHRGHKKLNAAVAAFQHQFPGSVFRVTSPVQENFGVGRCSWECGPPGGAAIEKGIDVGRMKDGKLVALYVFVDGIST
jgi:hypothetical protein